jgi:hypothetical protein
MRNGPLLFGLVGALVASLGANLYLTLIPPAPPVVPVVERPKPGPTKGPCAMAQGGCRSNAPCGMAAPAGLTLAKGQRDRLTRCCMEASAAEASLLNEINDCSKKLRAKLHDHPPDRALVEGLAVELGRLRGELLSKRVGSILVVQETLTAEQISRLSEGE